VENWSCKPYGNKGINASNFELSKSGSSITIQSQNNQDNAPIAIDFKDFKIETVSSMVEKRSTNQRKH
jgi:hypothetical protein